MQQKFIEILDRYLKGEATPEEEKLVNDWYSAMNMPFETPLSASEEIAVEKSLHDKVKKHVKSTMSIDGNRASSFKPYWIAAAAVAAFLIVSTVYVFLSNPAIESNTTELFSSQWKEIKNTSLQQQIVTLPDGSRVTLKQHSQIKFPAAFEADHREVFLEGEAFFEVTKDNKRPFMVYAQEIVTRVLGTSFTVKALGEKVTVAVKTGKVSVYRKTGAPQQVVLTPNQQAVYGKSAEQVSHTLVQTPEIILPPAEVTKMHFEEAPVSEIFNALEIAYGVDIVYDEAKLAGCSLTTSLLDEPLYTRLNIICKAIGATYAVNDIQVVVESDGCH